MMALAIQGRASLAREWIPTTSNTTKIPAVFEEESPREAVGSLGVLGVVGTGFEIMKVGFGLSTLCAVLLTVVCMALFGPFGFFPALLIAPFFMMAEASGWISSAIEKRIHTHRRNEMRPRKSGPEPVPPKRKLLTKTRPERTPGRLDRAFEAHRSLPKLLDDLADESTPLGQRVAGESLRLHLQEHFSEEEEDGGVFEEMLALKPSLRESLEEREEEHVEILIELNEVLRSLRKDEPGGVLARQRLIAKIRAHQRAEDELFEQAYGIYVGDLSSV